MAKKPSVERNREEARHVAERSTPRTPVIYETVRQHGEEEMVRPTVSLWWSGVAAGLSISFSLLAQAILLTHLPESPWRPLLAAAGYPIGFLIVVLGRQQLFTETTITAVLPVMAEPSRINFVRLARMWSIVFFANMTGTFLAATFCTFAPALSPEQLSGMLEISRHAMEHGWVEMFFRGISAGFLMAAMVWLLPGAGEGAQFYVVLLMTYLIGVGGFTHIVAGSVEAFLLLWHGEFGIGPLLANFTTPVLLGNIVGGTVLFALLSYAQVMSEIE